MTDKYEIGLADFPWPHTDFGTGKLPYKSMSWGQIRDFDWREYMGKRFVLFSWITCPLFSQQVLIHEHWREKFGWRSLGVPFVWLKTKDDGELVKAVGTRPTLVKPQMEFVLAYTNVKKGRPFGKDLNEKMTPWVEAPEECGPEEFEAPEEFYPDDIRSPRAGHSVKPACIRSKIEALFPQAKRRIELFARGEAVPGWDNTGDQAATPRTFK